MLGSAATMLTAWAWRLAKRAILFDVKSDGTSILVPFGKADQARMYLAEKGLPTSNNAGYELFDNMGSLGLTSFMQEITRVRALEGEISRTIQAMRGIKAARVHIVLPEKGSFRRGDQAPSASVVIRTEGDFAMESAQSIRQLVAAAVPQLTAAEVTILDTNGRLLASKDDGTNAGAVMSATLEQNVSASVDENIRKALAPYLGVGHFQTSVQVALDTDRRQTNETVFDPESRVERSVRVVRESGDSKNSTSDNATGVEQNIPQEEIASKNGDSSTEKTDKREELTNYEFNSKTVSTVQRQLSDQAAFDRGRHRSGAADGDGRRHAGSRQIRRAADCQDHRTCGNGGRARPEARRRHQCDCGQFHGSNGRTAGAGLHAGIGDDLPPGRQFR